ncbi:transcription initiation factor TFIID subunit 8 [Batrachochytrium dendrobatidis]|nr:transcription initiation factor TFIID subunit 8 [Batrachochytrium dendrobatidis]KAK5672054.1 transcription initiation factor TFIID subunit 8 [Batrachochytrium dendrobatidis]
MKTLSANPVTIASVSLDQDSIPNGASSTSRFVQKHSSTLLKHQRIKTDSVKHTFTKASTRRNQPAPQLTGSLLCQVHQTICARILQQVGFESISAEALGELESTLDHYLFDLTDRIRIYAELNGHTRPTLQDISMGLVYFGVSLTDLHCYAKEFITSHQQELSNVPITLHSAPTDQSVWEANPFFSNPTLLTEKTMTKADGQSLQLSPKWMKSHFPPLPPPHSYLSSKIPMHPDTEGVKEISDSIEQARLMERNLKKLLFGGVLDDVVDPQHFEPVNYLEIKYRRV